jgi:hypothetical protein
MHFIVDRYQYPSALAFAGQGHGSGRQQVGRAVGTDLAGAAHGTGEYQGLRVLPQQVEQPGAFFQRVGALGHHHALRAGSHLRIGPVQQVEQVRQAERGAG